MICLLFIPVNDVSDSCTGQAVINIKFHLHDSSEYSNDWQCNPYRIVTSFSFCSISIIFTSKSFCSASFLADLQWVDWPWISAWLAAQCMHSMIQRWFHVGYATISQQWWLSRLGFCDTRIVSFFATMRGLFLVQLFVAFLVRQIGPQVQATIVAKGQQHKPMTKTYGWYKVKTTSVLYMTVLIQHSCMSDHIAILCPCIQLHYSCANAWTDGRAL